MRPSQLIVALSVLTAVAVPAEATPLFTQTFPPSGTFILSDVSPSAAFPDGVFIADDFVLANAATVTSITWRGTYLVSQSAPPMDNFYAIFYSESPGQPLFPPLALYNLGNAVNRTGVATFLYEYTATLDVPLALSAGTYWLAIVDDTSTVDLDDNWYWAATDVGNALYSVDKQQTWGDPTLGDFEGARTYFSLDGTLADTGDPVPEPATLTLLGLGLAGIATRRRRRQ